MKTMKWMITLGILFGSFSLSAQTKWQKEKAQTFADAAAKEWGLDDKQKAAMYEAQLESVVAAMEVGKEAKAGTITIEEKKSKQMVVWSTAKDKMSKITGKTKKEITDFQTNLREKSDGKKKN